MMDRGTVRNMWCFFPKIKFEKLVHLVGFIIRIYHDARSPEHLIGFYNWNGAFYCVIRAESLRVIWLIFLQRINPALENAWVILSATPLSANDTAHITEMSERLLQQHGALPFVAMWQSVTRDRCVDTWCSRGNGMSLTVNTNFTQCLLFSASCCSHIGRPAVCLFDSQPGVPIKFSRFFSVSPP